MQGSRLGESHPSDQIKRSSRMEWLFAAIPQQHDRQSDEMGHELPNCATRKMSILHPIGDMQADLADRSFVPRSDRSAVQQSFAALGARA